jgi:phosphoglucosamine mutase
VILAPWTVTGDGLLTALAVLSEWDPDALVTEGLEGFTRYPQVLVNVPVPRAGFAWEDIPPLVETVRAAEAALGADGRIVVRPSGTEPVLRIMVEGREADQIRTWADRLVAVAREALEPATAPTGE